MGRPVLSRRVTTCGQCCGKVLLLNVCTQAQREVRVPINIYLSVPGMCTQGSITFHVCTWVIPPYFLKAAFVTIFIRKIFRLKVKNTTGLILKKSSFLRNEVKTGYHYNHICLQTNKYVHWVNEWRYKIYCESWTILRSERKWLRKKFILFIIHVRKFWGLEEKTKIG